MAIPTNTAYKNTIQVDVEKMEPIYRWLLNGGENLKTPVGNYDFCFRFWSDVRAVAQPYATLDPPWGLSPDQIPGSCGSICCIGGAIEALYGEGEDLGPVETGKLVGLDSVASNLLFFGTAVFRSNMAAQDFAKVVKKLMDENVVDWSVV
jgi:hypothetical protein